MPRNLPVILLAVPFLVGAACGDKGAEFRHAAHLTVTNGACPPCHGPDPGAPRRATDADCAACHRQAQQAEAPGAGRSRVGKSASASAPRALYDGARFSHGPHAAAGVPCAECHAASRWRGNRFVLPTAEECSACHAGTAQGDARRTEWPGGGSPRRDRYSKKYRFEISFGKG